MKMTEHTKDGDWVTGYFQEYMWQKSHDTVKNDNSLD